MSDLDNHASRIKKLNLIKFLSFIGVLLCLFIGLIAIENLLLSFVIALMISYLVSPLIDYIEGAGVSRIVALLIVYSFTTLVTGVLIYATSPLIVEQFASLRGRLPEYVDGTVKLFGDIASTLELSTGGLIKFDFSDHIRDFLTQQSTQLVENLPSALGKSASVLFLSPLLGFFMIKDGHRFSRELLKLVPNNIFELVLSVQYQISQQIGHYVRARIIEAIIVGLVCLVGFIVIQFPLAMLLATFAALCNLIPYVGPFIGAAPGIVLALINHADSMTLTLVAGVYILAQLIDNFIIIPLVVARIVNLHPLTVILVVLLGAQFMGVLGMLISIPLASALKVTFRSIYTHLTDNSI